MEAIAQGRMPPSRQGHKHLAEMAAELARQGMPCAQKRRHSTFDAAVAACLRRVEGGHVQALSPYQCRHCNGWHLTRKDQGKRMPRFVAKQEHSDE